MIASRTRIVMCGVAVAIISFTAFYSMHGRLIACTNDYAALFVCNVPNNVAMCAMPPGSTDCTGNIFNPRTGAAAFPNYFGCAGGSPGTYCSKYTVEGKLAVAPCYCMYRCRMEMFNDPKDPWVVTVHCVPDISFPVAQPVSAPLWMTFLCPQL